jgi:5'-3' exonuclease
LISVLALGHSWVENSGDMRVHLIDGTYELFRCYFGAPSYKNSAGREVGATRALVRSLAAWLRTGEVTHVACAFDHVIESFRNRLFAGYKTAEGIDPDLYAQFGMAERAVASLGITVWPMIEFEADDALATGAVRFAAARSVQQVLLCSPDKDLAQCVRGRKIVGFNRQRNTILDETGVREKFGVSPKSIPDLLALVGDTADGIPGLPRWGMKSAAAVLATYGRLERIPENVATWTVSVRGAASLAESLTLGRKEAMLYRRLATLRFDVPLKESLRDLKWLGGDREAIEKVSNEAADPNLSTRLNRWRPSV